MRPYFALALLALTTAVPAAQTPTGPTNNWNVLKNLGPNQQVRVSLRGGATHRGVLLDVTENTLSIGEGKTLDRAEIQSVRVRRPSHRGKHVLIGAAVGAGAGLGVGAGVDNSCSANSIVCTGDRGKAIGAPLFGAIGAGIGALLPAGGGWEEIYRSE